jgi:hypothetical protein
MLWFARIIIDWHFSEYLVDGVLEYWSIGSSAMSYITPILHYSVLFIAEEFLDYLNIIYCNDNAFI